MSFSPYLGFSGTCREAMTFYADLFGATDLMIMTPKDAPPGAMEGFPADMVMHSQFSLGSGTLMAADAPPGRGSAQQGVMVYHAARDVPAARALFGKLAEGGEIAMPFDKTFWSPGFGMCRDRFGTNWIITVPMGTEG